MLQVRGTHGELRVGYQVAGLFGPWTMTRAEETLGDTTATCTTRLQHVNEFWINQTPMKLRLFMGKCWWVWDNVLFNREPLIIQVVGDPHAEGA